MPSLRHIVRRFCPSFILPSSSSSVYLSTEVGGEGELMKDEDQHEDTPTVDEELVEDDDAPVDNGPRPSFAHTRHLMLSSRSSFLDLSSTRPPTMKDKNNKSKKNINKKLSFSPSLYGSRPQTAPPSTPTPSPRLLNSLSRYGPSSPALPLPRLSFSATPPRQHGNRKQSGQLGTRNDVREREMMMTPPLSFCSKEVAEDPFARVCPSPEFSRPSSVKPSIYPTSSRIGSPTVSRPPSSSRRLAASSSKSSLGHLGKTSIRPSTAPALSSPRTTSFGATTATSISTSTQEQSSEIRDPFLDTNCEISEKTKVNSKPILSPLSTSIPSSLTISSSNELSRSISSTSHTSSSSTNSFPSSPTSPAELVSTFSSSYSSIRSGFSDATFTTLDTVVTGSNVSNEGGNNKNSNNSMNAGLFGSLPSKNRYGNGFGGRMRSNAIAIGRNEEENNAPLLSYHSRSIMQHGFFEDQTSKKLPSSSTVIETSPSSKMKKNDGKAKMLLGMPIESAMNTDHSKVKENHINDNADRRQCVKIEDEENDSIPDEVVLRGIEAQDERLKSKTSLRFNNRPAHVHSRFIEDLLHEENSLLASSPSASNGDNGNSSFVSSFVTHQTSAFTKDQFSDIGLRMKDATFPVCKRSFTAPAAVLRDSQGLPTLNPFSSDFKITDPIQVPQQEEDENKITAGNESTTDSTASLTDYANRHISFTQSTYDLVLHYGGEERTAIPLPQMSWFPEPPPFAPCTLLASSSSSSSPRRSSPSSSSSNPLFSARRKMSSVGPSASSSASAAVIQPAKSTLWNGMFKGRNGEIEKVSIEYPLPMMQVGDYGGAVSGKKA